MAFILRIQLRVEFSGLVFTHNAVEQQLFLVRIDFIYRSFGYAQRRCDVVHTHTAYATLFKSAHGSNQNTLL